MIISLDFDDTYTRDPEAWDRFIVLMRDHGHTVYCITMRYEREMADVYNTVGKLIGADHCIPTGRKAKQQFIADRHGLHVDVWIDDNPPFILMDAAT